MMPEVGQPKDQTYCRNPDFSNGFDTTQAQLPRPYKG